MADLRLPTQVRQDFHDVGSEVSVPVAAIKALSGVIKRSTATTMMGLQIELKAAADDLKAQQLSHTISLEAGCELFLRYVTRCSLETKVRQRRGGVCAPRLRSGEASVGSAGALL